MAPDRVIHYGKHVDSLKVYGTPDFNPALGEAALFANDAFGDGSHIIEAELVPTDGGHVLVERRHIFEGNYVYTHTSRGVFGPVRNVRVTQDEGLHIEAEVELPDDRDSLAKQVDAFHNRGRLNNRDLK